MSSQGQGHDCLISVQSLEENTTVVSVCEGVAAIPSVLRPHFAHTSTRIFIHHEAVISLCAFLPSTREFLADREYVQLILGTPLTRTQSELYKIFVRCVDQ